MYHGIEEKYTKGKYAKIIKIVQEVGVVKIILQLPEDIISKVYDLELCANLCRGYCKDLEREKEKYIKHGIFTLFKRKERERKIKEIENKKHQFITLINFYEMTKIFNGEIAIEYTVTSNNISKVFFCIKFKNEDDAIRFALIFSIAFPECIYKE